MAMFESQALQDFAPFDIVRSDGGVSPSVVRAVAHHLNEVIADQSGVSAGFNVHGSGFPAVQAARAVEGPAPAPVGRLAPATKQNFGK